MLLFAASVPYLDLAVLAFVVICGLVGLKKGFWMSLLSLFSGIVILVIAYFTAPLVAGWLKDVAIVNAWVFGESGSILSVVNKAIPLDVLNVVSVGTEGALQTMKGSSLSLIAGFLMDLVSGSTLVTEEMLLGNALALVLTDIAYKIICGILIFIALKIVVGLLKRMFEKMHNRGFLGGVNRLFGFILGLVKGAAFMILLLVLLFLFQEKSFLAPITNEIENNTVALKPITTMVNDITEKAMEQDNWLGNTLKSLRAFSIGKDDDTTEAVTLEEFLTKYDELFEDDSVWTDEQRAEIIADFKALTADERSQLLTDDEDLYMSLKYNEAIIKLGDFDVQTLAAFEEMFGDRFEDFANLTDEEKIELSAETRVVYLAVTDPAVQDSIEAYVETFNPANAG